MASETPRTAAEEWKWRRREAIIRDEYTCQECGAKGGPEGDAGLEVHHITPVAEGGSDDLENLETLCSDCHHEHHSDEPVRNSGWFEKEHVDEDFLEAIEALGGTAGTAEVADEVGCPQRTAYHRLDELRDAGRIEGRKIGGSIAWMLAAPG